MSVLRKSQVQNKYSIMSEQIPNPKFKVGDVIVCNDPVAQLFGVLFFVKSIDTGCAKGSRGTVVHYGEHSYRLEYVSHRNPLEVNTARGKIIDEHWDLAPPEVQILYGRMDSKQT